MQFYDDLYWNSDDGLCLYVCDYVLVVGQLFCGMVVCIFGLICNVVDFDVFVGILVVVGWCVFVVDLCGCVGLVWVFDLFSYNLCVYVDDMVVLLCVQYIDKVVFVGILLGVLVIFIFVLCVLGLVVVVVFNDVGFKVLCEVFVWIGMYVGKFVLLMDLDQVIVYVVFIGKVVFLCFIVDDWQVMVICIFWLCDDGLLELDYDLVVICIIWLWVLWLLCLVLWCVVCRLMVWVLVLMVCGVLLDILFVEVVCQMVVILLIVWLVEVLDVGYVFIFFELEVCDVIFVLLECV